VKTKEVSRFEEFPGRVLLSRQIIRKRIRELGRRITKDYSGKALHLIGVLKGASIFHADLVRAINLEVSFDFIAVGSYNHSTHSSGEVRILKDLDESPDGKDILLVEDIVDTGLTLNYLRKSLQSRTPKSLKTVTLLSKPSRRAMDVPVEYVGFEIPDEFVVGYGLDYRQQYRNLPDIWVLRTDYLK
jgi:hypoxanthine phosphoribosyltransferase